MGGKATLRTSGAKSSDFQRTLVAQQVDSSGLALPQTPPHFSRAVRRRWNSASVSGEASRLLPGTRHDGSPGTNESQ